MSRRACAFFSPRLAPVLDRGKRDKDAVVSPEGPTRWSVGHAVLDHEPHGQVSHAVGVLTAGWGQIGEVRVKVLATLCTVVLRRGDHQITRTPHGEIPEVGQRPLGLLIPGSLVRATWTGLSRIGATVGDALWRGQVGNRRNPFGGIGSIRTRTEHGFVLPVRMLGPALYDTCPSGAIPKPGKDEHNYGHGEQHLSVVFAMLMMLAFLVDQAQQLCCALFQAVWAKLGSNRLLWERMRALFYTDQLDSMRALFEALFYGFARSRPLLRIDSSSTPPGPSRVS